MKRSNTSRQQQTTSLPRRRAVAAAALFSAVAAATASAQLVYEPFDYGTNNTGRPIGSLFGGPTNPMSGSVWFEANSTPAANQFTLQSTGPAQVAGLDAFGGGAIGRQDVPLTTGFSRTIRTSFNPTGFASNDGTTVYYSFALKVTDLTGVGTTPGILAGFNNTFNTLTGNANPSAVGTRLQIRVDPGDSSKYDLGLQGNITNNGSIQWDSGHALNDTVFVVGSYKWVDGAAGDVQQMWINPTSLGAATAPAATLVKPTGANNGGVGGNGVRSFIFRDDNGTTGVPRGIQYDELRIDTRWSQVTAAAGSTYIGTGVHNWGDAGVWDTTPDAPGAFAYLKGAGGTVTVDTPRTVGTLTFRSATPYNVADAGENLTIDDGAGTSGMGYINVQAAPDAATGAITPVQHQIGATLLLSSNLTVSTAAQQTLAITGNVSGPGGQSLTKIGRGTLLLGGTTNGYTGPTIVNGGTLRFATNSGLSTSQIRVGVGGAVGLDTGSLDATFLGKINASGLTQSGALALAPADAGVNIDYNNPGGNGGMGGNGTLGMSIGAISDLTYTGNITPSAAGYRLGGGAGVLTVGSNLVGGNAVTVTNFGTVKPRGANTYTGATRVEFGGTLNLDAWSRLGSTSGVTFDNGVLQFDADFTTGTFTIGTGGVIIDTNGHNPAAAGGAGQILGANALTKVGDGEFFTFNVAFYNPLSLKGGTWTVGNESQLGNNAGASTINLDGGALRVLSTFNATAAHTVQVTGNGGTMQIDNGQTVTWNGAFNGNGTFTKGDAVDTAGNAGTGLLILGTDSPSFNGKWRLTSGFLAGGTDAKFGPVTVPISLEGGFLTTPPGTSVTLSHPIEIPDGGGTGSTSTDGTDVLTLTGAITGPGGFLKESNNNGGTVVLAGTPKAYGGPTTVVHGTLQIASGANDMLPVGNGISMVGTSGVLDLQNTTQHVGSVTLTRGAIIGAGGGTLVSSGSYNVLAGSISANLAG
jgi:autotransporter-associated beta strand protein